MTTAAMFRRLARAISRWIAGSPRDHRGGMRTHAAVLARSLRAVAAHRVAPCGTTPGIRAMRGQIARNKCFPLAWTGPRFRSRPVEAAVYPAPDLSAREVCRIQKLVEPPASIFSRQDWPAEASYQWRHHHACNMRDPGQRTLPMCTPVFALGPRAIALRLINTVGLFSAICQLLG
jgi:hypothetical protein